ncbi:hypothetical protein K402DRAFT_31854 [Aulographum hederae CBS 113979]|uniref:tRNA (guanine(9)-N1)-methyltransferase n=1 Tax=Aulographum hederae CBS 113979 TaxID=1176131 RepID=A0A6G1H5B5_9PEZI|nr:hypothetical protein K402DRAFT_31854 [Aulographum hederae CBS 113979]
MIYRHRSVVAFRYYLPFRPHKFSTHVPAPALTLSLSTSTSTLSFSTYTRKMEEGERPRKIQKLGSEGAPQLNTPSIHSSTKPEDGHEETSNAISAEQQNDSPGPAPVTLEPSNGATAQETQDEEDPSNAPKSPTDDPSPAHDQPRKGKGPSNHTPNPLSKNQQKKIRRQQEWDAMRESRRLKRRDDTKARKERKRETITKAIEAGFPPPPKKGQRRAIQLPVTFIVDCGFDDLMLDYEIKSLGAQLTRSYSDNRNGKFKVHLAVSSWGGNLKERFDGVLAGHHKNWPGVRFFDEGFVEVADMAKKWMVEKKGGVVDGALRKTTTNEEANAEGLGKTAEEEDDLQEKKAEDDSTREEEGEIIYLSSESDDTLTELKPYSTYIIGGLVDKNRHKGICHRRATEKGIKTAKLPIGEFLAMNSRAVLATNHVNEIMLKWLELGDWGEAFMKVIPKRKGGALKNSGDGESSVGEGGASTPADSRLEGEEAADDDMDVGDSGGGVAVDPGVEDEEAGGAAGTDQAETTQLETDRSAL